MTTAPPIVRVRGAVNELSGVDVSTFRERFEAADRPLVMRGGARSFPGFGRWYPDYLTQKVGDVRVPHKLSETNKHPDFNQRPLSLAFARGESTLAELVQAVTTGSAAERARRLFTGDERFLLRRREGVTRLDPELAPLWDDVRVPPFVTEERLYTAWLWFSGRGVRTWLHYDNNGCHNLNAQMTGRKECVLFEPSAVEPFYFFDGSDSNPAHNCSAVDVNAPDPRRFPRFAEAVAWTASLEAGDLLFIPAWWPHAFFHLGEFNSNVNFWWTPDSPRENAVSRRQTGIDVALALGAKPPLPVGEL